MPLSLHMSDHIWYLQYLEPLTNLPLVRLLLSGKFGKLKSISIHDSCFAKARK